MKRKPSRAFATEVLEISKVRIDGQTQPRAQIDMDTVADYAETMAAGEALPPVVVYHDGAEYWLADGFHRYHAARRIGMDTLEAQVHDGDCREAVLYSVGANADHGLRRTPADKRKAVLRLLEDPEWSAWSDREIARRCRVHHQMVGNLRVSLDESSSDQPASGASERTYTTKHGTTATMSTEKIGRGAARERADVRRVADPDICQVDSDDVAQGVQGSQDVGCVDTGSTALGPGELIRIFPWSPKATARQLVEVYRGLPSGGKSLQLLVAELVLLTGVDPLAGRQPAQQMETKRRHKT